MAEKAIYFSSYNEIEKRHLSILSKKLVQIILNHW